MKKTSSPALELATTLTIMAASFTHKKIKAVVTEKKRLKDGNIFKLKPEDRS